MLIYKNTYIIKNTSLKIDKLLLYLDEFKEITIK